MIFGVSAAQGVKKMFSDHFCKGARWCVAHLTCRQAIRFYLLRQTPPQKDNHCYPSRAH